MAKKRKFERVKFLHVKRACDMKHHAPDLREDNYLSL